MSSVDVIEGARVLVAGGGGFIGGHLARELLQRGAAHVRTVDVKPSDQWFQHHAACEEMVLDLSDPNACRTAVAGQDLVFNLAADMGGMGFIEQNKALCMLSVLINTNLLIAARDAGVDRYLFSSSACVYNAEKQTAADVTALREDDAYPAMPEDGYGWEKLFSERMCRHFTEDFGIETRVVRYHNVYGPYGTWDGGREKAPAALCRKVIEAELDGTGEIEIWGDGEQTRSFMFIDDCLEGTIRIMESAVREPLNLGSDRLVSVNGLVDIIESIAGTKHHRRHVLDAPLGVRGRNSDNTLLEERIGWVPQVTLEDGLSRTYAWIRGEMLAGRASIL